MGSKDSKIKNAIVASDGSPKSEEVNAYTSLYKRPDCEEFLKFCFERFEVGLWSSAREHNLTGVLTNVIGELKSNQTLSIFPRNYDPENKEDDFLGPDGELRVFLDGLAEAKDVPTYVKDHPTGEPAITSSHPDWDYYSKINRSLGKKETRTN
ncbi:putative FCP1-like domain, HAD-like domain protein [Tanacetum coccineum]